jgi:signal transduction histidine kinase
MAATYISFCRTAVRITVLRPRHRQGEYVVVSISDTGTGMDEKTLAQAFEPFFTTKEIGSGSGLGLPMVQGFAAQSGGDVRIHSKVGEGTTVEIWLPRANELPSQTANQSPSAVGEGSDTQDYLRKRNRR